MTLKVLLFKVFLGFQIINDTETLNIKKEKKRKQRKIKLNDRLICSLFSCIKEVLLRLL